jgi:hypothetical protein
MSLRIFFKSYVLSSYVIKIELTTTGQERMNISVKIKLHVWRGAPEVLHAGL